MCVVYGVYGVVCACVCVCGGGGVEGRNNCWILFFISQSNSLGNKSGQDVAVNTETTRLIRDGKWEECSRRRQRVQAC